MNWTVSFCDEFGEEFAELDDEVKVEIARAIFNLQEEGPMLGRPHADTLNDSKYNNMKEYRFNTEDGVWRMAFAFDPERQGILLCAADKTGTAKKRFYKRLIKTADDRFENHLQQLKEG